MGRMRLAKSYVVMAMIPAALHRYAAVPGMRSVASIFTVSRLVIYTMVVVSLRLVPAHVPIADIKLIRLSQSPPALAGFDRWDAVYYEHIVAHGYDLEHSVFFPLYPLLTKIASLIVPNLFIAGVTVSLVSLFLALVYLYRLTVREYGERAGGWAVFYLAFAPETIVFSSMYAEGLFVLLVVATFYHARRSQWVRAALLGALASATRNTGVLLSLSLTLEVLQQQWAAIPVNTMSSFIGRDVWQMLRRSWRGLLAAAFVPVGLLAYMAYSAFVLHDPLAFVHAENRLWGRALSLEWLKYLLPSPPIRVAQLIDLLVTIILIPLVAMTVLRMRPMYGVYTLFSFVIMLCSGGLNYTAMTRYALALVPLFMLLGRWSARREMVLLITVVSVSLSLCIAFLFSHWYGPA